MECGQALDLLVEHQHGIRKLLSEWKSLVDSETGNKLTSAAVMRWKLLRVLRAYQLFKHQEIFDPLYHCENSGVAQSAVRLKERCIETGLAYVEYVQDRTIHMAAPDVYLTATRQIIGRVEQHLNAEGHQVRALLRNVLDTREAIVRRALSPQMHPPVRKAG